MRRRISWLVVATTSTVVFSFVIPLCLLVRTLAEDRATAAADQEARNVAILVAQVNDRPQLRELVVDLDERAVPSTGVLTADGQWLGAGAAPAIDAEIRRARDGAAFTVVDDRGGRVLLPVVDGSGAAAVVRSTVTTDDLHQGVTRAWLGILGLGAVLMVVSLGIASWLGRRVSEPLREVAEVAHRLREGDLSARAEVSGTDETEELARALNGLAERTAELLATERGAVADLSHRLRTPVTALRLDAESVPEPELATRLQAHITALQRTIDAIVKDARRPVRTDLAPLCDATQAVGERLTFWSVLAEDQGRPVTVDLDPGPLAVRVGPGDLADLVDVLVDNVFAHTPEGTALRVRLHRRADGAHLEIADDGPGMPMAGRRERPGSTGLGLDIARRTAAAAGGHLRVDSSDSGTRVEVLLPVASDGRR